MEWIYINSSDALGSGSTWRSRLLDRSAAAMGKRMVLVENCGNTTAGLENKSLLNMMDHVGLLVECPPY